MSLKIVNVQGTLHVRGRFLGVQVRRSTRLPVSYMKEAEQMRMDIERQIVEGSYGDTRRDGEARVADAVQDYVERKTAEKHKTKSTYIYAYEIRDKIGRMSLKDLTWEIIDEQFVKQWYASGNKPGTVRRKLNIMSAIFKQAEEKWGIRTVKLVRPRVDDAREVHLNKGEANEFLQWVYDHHPEYHPHFTVLIDTGVRLSEMLRMRRRDFGSESVSVRKPNDGVRRKTNSREVPLTPALSEMVPLLPDGQAFPMASGLPWKNADVASKYLNEIIHEAVDELGLPEFRLHDLRHTFAYLVAQAGADIADLQGLMGHADIKQTMRYRGFVPSRAKVSVVGARI
jgi:integrase